MWLHFLFMLLYLHFLNQFVEWNTLKSGEKLRSIVIEDPLYQDNSMPLSGVFALDFDGRHVLMRGKEDAYLYTVGYGMRMLLCVSVCVEVWSFLLVISSFTCVWRYFSHCSHILTSACMYIVTVRVHDSCLDQHCGWSCVNMAGVTFVSLRAIVEVVLVCTLSAHRNADGHLYLYVVCM